MIYLLKINNNLMNQINSTKNEDENQIETSPKLLGNKIKRFKIIKKAENNKSSSPKSQTEPKMNEGRWSYDEQVKFIIAISKDGTNWRKIKKSISTRSLPQIRSHAQKFYNRLKMCKNEKLGIDFTSNEIQGIKDMINHIKSINSNYDIAKIFLFFANKLNIENKDEKFDESNSENFNKDEKDNPNLINEEKKNFPQVFNDINKLDVNKMILLNSINNFNNFNLMTLNYFNNASVANNYVNFMLYMNYLQCLNNPYLLQQASLFNGINSIIPGLNSNFKNNITKNKFN